MHSRMSNIYRKYTELIVSILAATNIIHYNQKSHAYIIIFIVLTADIKLCLSRILFVLSHHGNELRGRLRRKYNKTTLNFTLISGVKNTEIVFSIKASPVVCFSSTIPLNPNKLSGERWFLVLTDLNHSSYTTFSTILVSPFPVSSTYNSCTQNVHATGTQCVTITADTFKRELYSNAVLACIKSTKIRLLRLLPLLVNDRWYKFCCTNNHYASM